MKKILRPPMELAISSKISYAKSMTLVFNEAAFKHGVSIEDIDYAMAVPLVDILLIGFGLNGNLLEIMYNR
jgi:hypothetical protein